MIDKKEIVAFVTENLGDGFFLVDASVSTNNVIHVYIDSNKGATLEDCIAISRKIEKNLDREKEDFELQVSTPGLGQPFKVMQQYTKNIGRKVEVISTEGAKFEGELIEVSKDGITLESIRKEKIEGRKKKQFIKEKLSLRMEQIKSTKSIISFK